MKAEEYLNGQIILVDKPLKWTSFQVVNKLRWALKTKYNLKKLKVGHAGTLDPLATGLLVLCTGKFTKKIDTLQADIKEYTGTLYLGATTASYDLETEINEKFPTEHVTEKQILEATQKFLGEIDQIPPLFSAIKKDGVRLYEIARRGETIEIKSRKTTIFEFEITEINLPHIEFRVVCSKGTYIRSLANDFGKSLNSGAHLVALRRTKSGEFHVENAIDPVDFVANLLQK